MPQGLGLRPLLVLVMATLLTACGDLSGLSEAEPTRTLDRRSPPGVDHTTATSPGLKRVELAHSIRAAFERIIAERDLPYVVTQIEFQDAEGVSEENFPEGPWLVVQFDDPSETGAGSGLSGRELLLETPLEAGLRPSRP